MTSTLVLAVGLESSVFKSKIQDWKFAGYFIVEASSTDEAFSLFSDGDFDIVLLGNLLPVESRERLAFLIRASCSKIPVVCLEDTSGGSGTFADFRFRNEHNDLVERTSDLLANRSRVLAEESVEPRVSRR